MKRAKIALTAIAVFAIVGGAVAIKATKFLDVKLFYYTTSIGFYSTGLKSTVPAVGALTTAYTAPIAAAYTTTWITATVNAGQ
jgi:hypothetical protein